MKTIESELEKYIEKTTAVASLDFTDAIYIKSPRDHRKRKQWTQVHEIQWMINGDYWIVKTNRFGWEMLSDCIIKQNARETDNVQPNLKEILDYCKRHHLKCVEEFDQKCWSEVIKIYLRKG